MTIRINAGRSFRQVYNEGARERLRALGVGIEAVPSDRDLADADVPSAVAGADVVLGTWGTKPFTADVLRSAPGLRTVIYAAGSVKGFVTPELVARGITVCSAAHINARPVAEFVLGVILCALKGVPRAARRLHETGPDGWTRSDLESPGYYGSVVGLVGLGKVSSILIRLLSGFDITVLVEDDYLTHERASALGVSKVTRDELWSRSDVVSLHHADVPQHWSIVNDRTLALMKDGATLVNTARGRLVDEAALVRALERRDLWAFLDVTHPEPPVAGSRLYELPNVTLTPHVAGSHGREVERMGDWAVDQLEALIAGRPLDGVVDLGSLDSIA